MPKPDRNHAVIRVDKLDRQHYSRTDRYARQVKGLYESATREYSQLAGTIFEPDPNKPFSFADYPETRKKAAKIAADLTKDVERVIEAGQRSEWIAGTSRADAYMGAVINRSKLTPDELAQYEDRNMEGLAAFQGRKVQGLSLSDQVWRITDQFTGQMELALDIAIGEGRSAEELSRDVRDLLKEPNRLFRRVRDKYGNLQLSKAAKAYHPGRGVYRSSYKNAMRLARTEINMAYRTSDWERWQREEFVVGIRIGLSNNHTVKDSKGEDVRLVDICDELAGDYPKTFKFVGWHPNCRCVMTPILQSEDELHQDRRARLRAIMNEEEYKAQPSANEVKDVPAGFTKFIDRIAEQSKGWKAQPYWIRDNFKGGTIAGGLSPSVPHTQPVGGSQAKPNIPPQPCTEFDAYINDLKAQAYALGLDVSKLDPLRASGERAPLKAEVDRLRQLADQRSLDWMDAASELKNYIKNLDNPPKGFTSIYSATWRNNTYALDRYYKTSIQALKDALAQAKAAWANIEAQRKKDQEKEEKAKAKDIIKQAKKDLAQIQKAANKILPELKKNFPSRALTLESAIYGVEMALRGGNPKEVATRLAEAQRWLFTYQNPMMPRDLHPGGDYLKKNYNDDYEFNTDFFKLLEKQPNLVIKTKGGSYETDNGRTVVLAVGDRGRDSEWQRRKVVYHEFGHAIADQRDLLYCTGTQDLMHKQRTRLRTREKDYYWEKTQESHYDPDTGKFSYTTKREKKEVNQMRIITLSKKISNIYYKLLNKKADDPIFTRFGITKGDATEQILSVLDVLGSLVNRSDVGEGHSVSYFKNKWAPPHEYLAHCFENAFIGNKCFQLLMPVEYQEMIDYIRTLKEP